MFRGHKRIPIKMLAHKYLPIVWFITSFDKTTNLAHYAQLPGHKMRLSDVVPSISYRLFCTGI